jgi:tetratricopeptide (TPR) repeat protein
MSLHVPALVIATTWPSALVEQVEAARRAGDGTGSTSGALLERLQERLPTQVEVLELEPISRDALRELVTEVAPATDDERGEALIEVSDGNPLVLQLELMSGRVRRSIVDDAITLSANELRQLPRGYEQLVAERFAELPPPEQRWLAEAASQGSMFFPDLLSAPTDGVDRARISGFVRFRIDNGVEVGRFLELPLLVGVSSVVDEEFTRGEREQWSAHLLEAYVRWFADDRNLPDDPSASAVFCERFVDLAESGGDVDPELVATAAVAWSFAERDADHLTSAVHAAERGVAWARRLSGGAYSILVPSIRRYAAALITIGDLEAGLHAAKEAASLLAEWDNAPPAESVDTYYVLAAAYSDNDESERAREVARQTKAAASQSDNPTHLIRALQLVAMIEDAAEDDEAAAEALSEAVSIAKATEPLDLELVVDLESDLAALPLFGGSPERWEELAAQAAAALGEGHSLHIRCLQSFAISLLTAGRIREAATVSDRLRDLDSLDEEQEIMKSLIAALGKMMAGDATAIPDAAQAYRRLMPRISSRKEWSNLASVIMMMELAGATNGGSREPSPDGGDHTWVTDWVGVLNRDSDAALRYISGAWDGHTTWREFERGQVVFLATQALTSIFAESGEFHPTTERLVGAFRQIADTGDFPAAVTVLLEALEDSLEIVAGGDPPERPTMEAMFAVRPALCRAVAWSTRGADSRLASELAAARSAATAMQASRSIWRTVRDTHQACKSPAEEDVWRILAALEGSGPERYDDAAGLGAYLYRQRRYDEAEAVESENFERAQSEGADAEVVLRLGINLAYTLEARGDQGDREREIEIRSSILDLASGSLLDAQNRGRLAELVGDRESRAAALARHAALERNLDTARGVLDQLAFLLHELDRPEAALGVCVIAIGLHPSFSRDAGAPTTVANLSALAKKIHPDGVAHVEEIVKTAGLQDRLTSAGAASSLPTLNSRPLDLTEQKLD